MHARCILGKKMDLAGSHAAAMLLVESKAIVTFSGLAGGQTNRKSLGICQNIAVFALLQSSDGVIGHDNTQNNQKQVSYSVDSCMFTQY